MILLRHFRAFIAALGLASLLIVSLDTPVSPSRDTLDAQYRQAEGNHSSPSSLCLRGARRQLLIHPNAIPVGLKGGGEHARIKCFWVRS